MVEGRLKSTLMDLAALGSKRAGTDAGVKAGDYVAKRFKAAGLEEVTFEPFSFLSFDLQSSSLALTLDGAPVTAAHDVFQYSGKGHVDADIIDVGLGKEADYKGKDVTGKVVLVTRDPMFHRSTQYRLAHEHGGAAMLYMSQAPDNLIQVGMVSFPEDGLAPIPAITVGADDGQKIKDTLAAGKGAHAVIDVEASVSPATGRNVVARLAGTDPTGAYVVVGAHYDTWFAGSTDNGGGTAMLLEMAEALAHEPKRKLGVVFVGYDGEELGLLGGYDFLRRHVVQANEPMLAFVNLEMPGAGPPDKTQRIIAHTNDGPVKEAATTSDADELYPIFLGMETVPVLFGGIIPTDIQGMYWSGLQGMSTYCDTPYYHTKQDTPDKVATAFLAQGALAMERMVREFDGFPVASFKSHDAKVWAPVLSTAQAASGDLVVDVAALDSSGAAQAAASVTVWVDVDDFTRAFKQTVQADSAGKAQVTVPKEALAQGSGHRWLHMTAGYAHPLAERLLPLP